MVSSFRFDMCVTWVTINNNNIKDNVKIADAGIYLSSKDYIYFRSLREREKEICMNFSHTHTHTHTISCIIFLNIYFIYIKLSLRKIFDLNNNNNYYYFIYIYIYISTHTCSNRKFFFLITFNPVMKFKTSKM